MNLLLKNSILKLRLKLKPKLNPKLRLKLKPKLNPKKTLY